MAEASLRFTRVYRNGDMPTSGTQFISGGNTRSEHCNCSGQSNTTPPTDIRYEYGPLRANIVNQDLNYLFGLDLESRIYTAYSMNEHGNRRWLRSRRMPNQEPSGKTVHGHTETIDSGERREIFGYTARHIVMKTRQTREGKLMSESEYDAWYIDPPAAWLVLNPPPKPGSFSYLVVGTGKRDSYKFSETGERETGFVLSGTRTHKSFHFDETGTQKVHETVSFEEVTDLSEAPLAASLFVPPTDFKRVPHLPDGMRYGLSHRLRLQWEMLKDTFSLPGRVAKFTT